MCRPSSAELYRRMLLIRRFEELLLRLFETGKLFGTTHGYIGQEAIAVGLLAHLNDEDIVYSSHRCHGHYLARTGDCAGLLAELMGKETGLVGGRGGSQHICGANFYTNGVQGGIVPVAAGMALAEKYKASGAIAVVFVGDGTLGEGVVYETLNMVSLWQIPLVLVLENNQYAQSTHWKHAISGDLGARFKAFGIPVVEKETFDVEDVYDLANGPIEAARGGGGPQAILIHTYRFCSHSKSPDGRDESEVAWWREKCDPLDIQRARLSDGDAEGIGEAVRVAIDNAVELAGRAPFPTLPEKE